MSFSPIARRASRSITFSIRTIPRQYIVAPAKFTLSTRHQSTMSSDQQIIFTKDAPAALGPYSQAIKTPNMIYCSGQIPLTPEGEMVQGITEQTRQACKNVQAVVEAAGSSISKVVKTTVFISDMSYFAEINTEYEKWFSHKPARSCVAVKTLPKNVDVEIEVIALP
ncbi:uncharacterized protein FTJAE_9616 [Fusarium tjaetaba]|uniref:TdcF protein n=1 Tax=Fusarium tjaetaba TaxID=1567544 RepID=A0A8H5R5M2_9HYPO|nr:uncharacterized protein FTJAE_9616 [Fusarium tjaetaba]KAF5626557.1 hypothetical protein FTJAE_9616 [Fusarium tjaetaba]